MPSRAVCLVVTGPPGAGKTALCRRVAEEARARGWAVAGFVTERRFADGAVVGRDVVDVATGARQALAETAGPTDGPARGQWHFHRAGFAFGEALCAAAPPDAPLIVDELGPLELVQGIGWAPLIPVLARRAAPVLVVVRPALLDAFAAAAGVGVPLVLDVERVPGDAALARALLALEPAP